jgi:hypothetical protein
VAITATSNIIERRRVMPPPNPSTTAQDLGDYIFDANPYTRKENPADPFPTPMNPDLTETEKDYQIVEWRFKNGSLRVAQSLRIPYYFTDEYGQTVKDYVLIGFEGAGGE